MKELEQSKSLFDQFRSWVQKDGLVLCSDQDIKGMSVQVKNEGGEYIRALPKITLGAAPESPKGFWYNLQEDTRVSFFLKNGRVIEINISQGFKWDGASIPKRLQDRVSPEQLIYPSLVHDFLYQKTGRLLWVSDTQEDGSVSKSTLSFNRHDADILFLYFCKDGWTSEVQAGLAFLAVQTFGESHFLNVEKANLEEVELTESSA